jgi:hypothetical protein
MALTEYRGYFYNPETKLFYNDDAGRHPAPGSVDGNEAPFTFEPAVAGMWPFGWPTRTLMPFSYATAETAERMRVILNRWIRPTSAAFITLTLVENTDYFGFKPSVPERLIEVNSKFGLDYPLRLNAGDEASKLMRNSEQWCKESFGATLKTAGIF